MTRYLQFKLFKQLLQQNSKPFILARLTTNAVITGILNAQNFQTIDTTVIIIIVITELITMTIINMKRVDQTIATHSSLWQPAPKGNFQFNTKLSFKLHKEAFIF